ncbi:MAG: hypothetical protein ACXVI9_02335 [Mucilaginibacter sp.]
MNYITGSCTISQGTVLKDGHQIFEKKGIDASAFLLSVYQHFGLNYPKFYKMDNLSKLGWLASEILLNDTFKKEDYQPEQIGLILANKNSSLDNDIKYFETVKDIASPSLFVYTLPNIVIGEICIRNNFKGEHAFFIQDEFDADFIENQVNYLLDNDILQACICGWVDILQEEYKAVLFLVEKQQGKVAIPFSAENMNSLFKKL